MEGFIPQGSALCWSMQDSPDLFLEGRGETWKSLLSFWRKLSAMLWLTRQIDLHFPVVPEALKQPEVMAGKYLLSCLALFRFFRPANHLWLKHKSDKKPSNFSLFKTGKVCAGGVSFSENAKKNTTGAIGGRFLGRFKLRLFSSVLHVWHCKQSSVHWLSSNCVRCKVYTGGSFWLSTKHQTGHARMMRERYAIVQAPKISSWHHKKACDATVNHLMPYVTH